MEGKRKANTKNEANYVELPPREDRIMGRPRVVLLNGDFSVYLFKTGPYICGHCGRISRSMNSLSAHFQKCTQAQMQKAVMPTIKLLPLDTKKQAELTQNTIHSIATESHTRGVNSDGGVEKGGIHDIQQQKSGGSDESDEEQIGSLLQKVTEQNTATLKDTDRQPSFGKTRDGKKCNRCLRKGDFCYQHSPKWL